VGETYYDYGQYDLALERFYATQALIRDNPRNKANKAGCYAKKKEYSKALTLLQEASAFNYDFNWYVGNLHEMKGDKELAVERYNYLYQKDTTVYSYCNERIQEIAQNAELFTELQFRNRRRRTLIILEGVNENSEDTEIGEMRLEIKE
jgi:tetratricopeptide (TPR) repeat protein